MMHVPIFTAWSSHGGQETFQFSKQLLSPSSLANIVPVVREAMETGSNLQDHSLEEDRDSGENLTFFCSSWGLAGPWIQQERTEPLSSYHY